MSRNPRWENRAGPPPTHPHAPPSRHAPPLTDKDPYGPLGKRDNREIPRREWARGGAAGFGGPGGNYQYQHPHRVPPGRAPGQSVPGGGGHGFHHMRPQVHQAPLPPKQMVEKDIRRPRVNRDHRDPPINNVQGPSRDQEKQGVNIKGGSGGAVGTSNGMLSKNAAGMSTAARILAKGNVKPQEKEPEKEKENENEKEKEKEKEKAPPPPKRSNPHQAMIVSVYDKLVSCREERLEKVLRAVSNFTSALTCPEKRKQSGIQNIAKLARSAIQQYRDSDLRMFKLSLEGRVSLSAVDNPEDPQNDLSAFKRAGEERERALLELKRKRELDSESAKVLRLPESADLQKESWNLKKLKGSCVSKEFEKEALRVKGEEAMATVLSAIGDIQNSLKQLSKAL